MNFLTIRYFLNEYNEVPTWYFSIKGQCTRIQIKL